MLNVILQSLWARFGNPSVKVMPIVMGMQMFIKTYQKVQQLGPVSRFSEFEPRQNLDQFQMSFDNLIGNILSISMCMQNSITIFFTVQEIGPFSLFENLELGKASTNKKVSSQSHGLDLVNFNVYATVCQLRIKFPFFQNLNLGKTSTNPKCHLTISWSISIFWQ